MAGGIEIAGVYGARARHGQRARIPFRSVNHKSSPEYDPGLQRHHLLPRQVVKMPSFRRMFSEIGRAAIGFDDFRFNGLLLPSNEEATLRLGMPLHRGPHRRYNEVVIERVGAIEERWSRMRVTGQPDAADVALYRLKLLQTALRRRLLSEQKRFVLNRKDPIGTGFDFTVLDAMAETLWQAT